MRINRRDFIAGSAAALTAPVARPHVARALTRKLRIGHNNSPTSTLHLAAVVFQQVVREKTEGRYDIDVYPSAQLGNDFQLVRAVSEGTMDMTISAAAILGAYHRDLELVELPYLFKDASSARKALYQVSVIRTCEPSRAVRGS